MFRSAGLCGLLLLLCFANPVSAIVTTGSGYTGVVSGASPFLNGVNLSGVVELITNTGIGCSGSLLSDGFSILTAGHCVTDSYGAALPSSVSVTFLGPSGAVSETATSISVDPLWNGTSTQGNDLAILHLSQAAPAFATGYSIFMGAPTTAPDVIAGYGYSGTGSSGADSVDYPFGTLRAGANEYATTGSSFGWSSNLLIGQFYDVNTLSSNALGIANPYSSLDEVDIAPGDSGGPTFYDGQIVGVHDLGICLGAVTCATPPSAGAANNSYFGELYGDTDAAASAVWIASQVAPEPASYGLLGMGLALMAAFRYRRSAARKPRG
jgi:secreted trypsin-like serine protease